MSLFTLIQSLESPSGGAAAVAWRHHVILLLALLLGSEMEGGCVGRRLSKPQKKKINIELLLFS